jgi:hypothetical protein
MKPAMSTTSPRELRTTLPARAYTDATWFTLELDRSSGIEPIALDQFVLSRVTY